MATEGICPGCGRPLAADAMEGLCPECLMKAGFGTGAAPGAGEPAGRVPFTPPSLEELARLFPQLEIVGLLGQGGMGAVYQARQPALERWVALKVLLLETANKAGFAERFSREAQALARLNHPNIVAVHEFGQAGGLPYCIMEYVEGRVADVVTGEAIPGAELAVLGASDSEDPRGSVPDAHTSEAGRFSLYIGTSSRSSGSGSLCASALSSSIPTARRTRFRSAEPSRFPSNRRSHTHSQSRNPTAWPLLVSAWLTGRRLTVLSIFGGPVPRGSAAGPTPDRDGRCCSRSPTGGSISGSVVSCPGTGSAVGPGSGDGGPEPGRGAVQVAPRAVGCGEAANTAGLGGTGYATQDGLRASIHRGRLMYWRL